MNKKCKKLNLLDWIIPKKINVYKSDPKLVCWNLIGKTTELFVLIDLTFLFPGKDRTN